MRILVLSLMVLAPLAATATELDMLPLGDPDLASELASAEAGAFFDTAANGSPDLKAVAERMAAADVVLLGEEHTAMDQKLFHAQLLDAMAASGRKLVLAMEFFQRSDGDALDRWARGESDEQQLLRETGWYDRGGYRWEYYRPVMEVARERGVRVVGTNVPREIPRAVNRGGFEGLSDEQRAEVGEVSTGGSSQHRYLISRYFGDTVAMLPPGWFDNMYAAQCLWDVVMARSILEVVSDDTTVVLIVGSGHVAYGLGISRRLDDERREAGLSALDVVTLCPATAPAPPSDGETAGHPMGGGRRMGAAAGPKAQFTRSLADYVAVFSDRGGVESFPTLGAKLKADDEGRPVVSIVFPDTRAEAIGFVSGDRILDANGTTPANLGELRFMLATMEWGERWGFRIRRGEEELEIGALLFPTVDISDHEIAPGFEVADMAAFDPPSPVAVMSAVVPEDTARLTMVTADGGASRVEVRAGDVLEEVHELNGDGRVERSLFRIAQEDGVVEIRYERDEVGKVIGTLSFDRTGAEID